MQTENLPKIIWIYWHDGIENTPPLLKRCYETWKLHNPDWEIRYLNNSNLIEYIDIKKIIPGIENKKITIQGYSNIIRISLLFQYGGIWVDSTLYCNQPLNKWIYNAAKNGFFAFSKPAPDRMIGNWFLAAVPKNYIVQKMYDKTLTFWLNREESKEYFWFHFLFADAYKEDLHFKNLWDNTVVSLADQPHYFLPYEKKLDGVLTTTIKKKIDYPDTPVFKLTHRTDLTKLKRNAVYKYLLKPDSIIPDNFISKIIHRLKWL